MSGLEKLFTEGIPTLAVAAVFIYYLIQRDRTNSKVFENFDRALKDFNKTLRNHLASQIKQAVATAHAQEEMSKAFQRLSDCITSLNHLKKEIR
jgi:hypothetical protein